MELPGLAALVRMIEQDMDLSDGVMKFWNSVENHKISLPDWHNSTWHDRFVRPGFGIVDCRE